MEYLQKFLSEYNYVVDLLQVVIFFIISIILFVKTGNIKFLKEAFKEMQYRDEHYQSKKGFVKEGQSFDNMQTVYRLNKATGELEDTGDKVDCQALIDSYADTVLDKVLERFLPIDTVQNEVVSYNAMNDDLDNMRNAFALADDYRKKFNMSDDTTVNDVFAEISKQSANLKEKIALMEQLKKKEIGGENGEKKIISESE